MVRSKKSRIATINRDEALAMMKRLAVSNHLQSSLPRYRPSAIERRTLLQDMLTELPVGIGGNQKLAADLANLMKSGKNEKALEVELDDITYSLSLSYEPD